MFAHEGQFVCPLQRSPLFSRLRGCRPVFAMRPRLAVAVSRARRLGQIGRVGKRYCRYRPAPAAFFTAWIRQPSPPHERQPRISRLLRDLPLGGWLVGS